jgi:hypothetical protein
VEPSEPPAKSKMPFWTSLTAFIRLGPKPLAWMRDILHRIHRTVHEK